jgi:hypothetical protein
MKKHILILNLIVKTIVELIIVCTVVMAVGVLVFTATYIYKSISNAIAEYKETINIE